MFVRNAWYVADFSSAFEKRDMLSLTIFGEPIVLYRLQDGTNVALEDRCVHRFARLSLGRVEGDELRCMYHGMRYNHLGQATEIPGQKMIPKQACVRVYPVADVGGWLWVWMGDPAKADLALIPPVIGLNDPDWYLPEDQMEFDCNYQLMNNNLTDLGHLAWVHTESFGADATWTNTAPKVTLLDRGVRIDRWLPNVPPIPPLGKAAEYQRTDIWSRLDYFVPGIFHLYNATYAPGAMEKFGGEAPPDDAPDVLFESYSKQAVTPLTEKTTRYMYTWGPSKRTGSIEVAEMMRVVLAKVFNEDKIIVGEQQRNIDLDPSRQPMPTVHDKGVVLFQRLMQRLMREEGSLEPEAPTLSDRALAFASE